jgi:hypothetical protein
MRVSASIGVGTPRRFTVDDVEQGSIDMGHVPEFDAEEDITNRHKIFNVMKVRIILSK